jgi:hypothetical protein
MHYSPDDNPLVHLNAEYLLHELTVILPQPLIFSKLAVKLYYISKK